MVLNWEKCQFMVSEGIVFGHKVSTKVLEVDRATIKVNAKLPPPINVKGIRSFLGHASFMGVLLMIFQRYPCHYVTLEKRCEI